MSEPLEPETLEAKIARLSTLDDVIEYRVMFGGSEYGRYETLEQAETRMIALRNKSPGITGYYELVTELSQRTQSDPGALIDDLRNFIDQLLAERTDSNALVDAACEENARRDGLVALQTESLHRLEKEVEEKSEFIKVILAEREKDKAEIKYWKNVRREVVESFEAQLAAKDKLLEMARDWAEHKASCKKWWDMSNGTEPFIHETSPCTCGLDELRAALSQQDTGSGGEQADANT